MINGYWRTQMVYAAAELGIADILADGPCQLDALARSTGCDEQSLGRLMRALAGFGVFAVNEAGGYQTTAVGRCLESGDGASLRARAIITGRLWQPAWSNFLHSVRTGQDAFEHTFGKPVFEYLDTDPDTAAVFDATMADSTAVAAREVLDAYDFATAGTVVDVGGGTGALLTALLDRHPGLRGVLVEVPAVAARARARLAGGAVESRCQIVENDFFHTVPAGGDTYLLSWILHDWDDERAVSILTNCRQAMSGEARLLIIDQLLPGRPEPALSVLYDLHMMAVTGGRERCEDEYARLLAAAGLTLTRTVRTKGDRSILEAGRSV